LPGLLCHPRRARIRRAARDVHTAATQFDEEEHLALRHQLQVLPRSRLRRPTLRTADRWLWVWLSHVWTAWRTVLVIVKPETVVGWHRRGFRLFWT
jgi:hypothetical protein